MPAGKPATSQDNYDLAYWAENVNDDYFQFGRYIAQQLQTRLQKKMVTAAGSSHQSAQPEVVFDVEAHKSRYLDAETGISFQIKHEEDVQNDDFHYRLCKSLRPAWTLKDKTNSEDLCYLYPACGRWRQHPLQVVLLAKCANELVVAELINFMHEKGLTKFFVNSIYSMSAKQETRDNHVTETLHKLSAQGLDLPSKMDVFEFMEQMSTTQDAAMVAKAHSEKLRMKAWHTV